MRKISVLLFSVFLSMSGVSFAGTDPSEALRTVPIQNNGRVKPFEAFARQTLELIAGKESWNKEPAVKVFVNALNHRDSILNTPWVKIDYTELLKTLELPVNRHYFSYKEILPHGNKVRELAMSGQTKRDADERPSKLEQKATQLYTKLIILDRLQSAELITAVPGQGSAAWTSPFTEPSQMGDEFIRLLKQSEGKDETAFRAAVRDWNQKVFGMTSETSEKKISLEVWYYRLRPFQLSWFFYFLTFLFLTLTKEKSPLKKIGFGSLALAFLFHTVGIVLRVVILSRAPVSNMYESMVFMNWALIVFAITFALIQKNTFVLPAGAVLSGLVMVYGDLLPIDTGLEVLVPVLRSNYWLTIHVMTIVSSYGAFGLALALGHRHLIRQIRGKFTRAQNDESARVLYRVIQLGTLLVGVGTVLGGVWANESWGRFWGWDPKETWALITFLGYLVVVHLRQLNKMSNFWLAMSSIFGFILVLMTWYGVNFILGRGLHSYGQGSGGMQWVIYYLAAEALFVLFILTRKDLNRS